MAMTPLEELRHSCSHVLATAVLRLFPDAKLDIGPPTDTGFYYVAKKNSRTMTDKLVKKKYDPVAKKHVEFREAKIK